MKKGEDVRISELAVLARPELIEMGDHIAIDQWTYISTQLKMGSYIHIAPSVSIIGGAHALLVMGDFTNIGSGSRIVCATDDFTQGLISPVVPIEHRTVINKPVVFETKDTEPWTIYAGSPARQIKKREKERIIESANKLMNYED